MRQDYEILPAKDVNGNALQISSPVILRIRILGAVNKIIFFVALHFDVKVLVGTQFINLLVTSICYIDRQVEFTKGSLLLHWSAPKELRVKELESVGDDYSKPATDTSTKKMDYYSKIMRQKTALCKHVTLPLHTQVWIKVMSKISGLISMEPKNFLRTECRVRSANGIHKVAENRLFETLISSFSTIEEKLPEGMITSYFTRKPDVHFAVNDNMPAGICESLNLILNYATDAPIH